MPTTGSQSQPGAVGWGLVPRGWQGCSSHSPVFDFLELQRRYRTLLVPSDFLAVHLSWLSAFPVSQPFSLHHPSRIQVSSEKEPAADAGAEPPTTDSDPTYSSKVSWLGSCHLIPLSRAEKALECLLHAVPTRYCCSPPRDWRNCIVVACCSWMHLLILKCLQPKIILNASVYILAPSLSMALYYLQDKCSAP